MDERIERLIVENLEYDSTTGKLFWKNNRGHVDCKGKMAGFVNKRGYCYVMVNGKQFLLHRIAWFLSYGKWPEHQIDHIDGDPTNNKIENLRDVTNRENMNNLKRHREGALVGASLDKSCIQERWRAMIKIKGKDIFLGLFKSKEEAHGAYMKAYEKLEEWQPDNYGYTRRKR